MQSGARCSGSEHISNLDYFSKQKKEADAFSLLHLLELCASSRQVNSPVLSPFTREQR
jgi:hypothetical protein